MRYDGSRPSPQKPETVSPERHFNEQEIAAILKRAAADHEPMRTHGRGLTLAELQQVGREAGISAESITRAAASIGHMAPNSPPPTTTLGVPVSVARTLELGGSFSGEDWDRLVADLQETFHAPGEVRRVGSLREWRHGNLVAHVEATQSGYRLRIHRVYELARSGLIGGAVLLAMGLFFVLLVAAKEGDADLAKLLFTSMFGLVGLGSIGVSAYKVRQWRSRTEQKMETIVNRTFERSGSQLAEVQSDSNSAGRIDPDLLADSAEEERSTAPRRTHS